jgi:Family of unknown function (DUF5670)
LYFWLLAAALFAAWLVGTLAFGKEGFIHILLLCAVALAVVQFAHERRARQP